MSRDTSSKHAAVSPLGLRLAHAVVFCALAAPVLWGSAPEWRHLAHALSRPFHAGAPPSALLLAAASVAALGVLALLLALARRRSAPLGASALVLLSLCLVWAARGARMDGARSEARANVAFLEVGRRVHLAMVGRLQQEGEVPRDLASWERALAGATARHDRVRNRLFQHQPPRILRVEEPEAPAQAPRVPGQLLAWVSSDGVTFELRLVGFGDGGPQLLRHPDGTTLVLKGLYNPELPPAAGTPSILPVMR